jgi:hypothetical protein
MSIPKNSWRDAPSPKDWIEFDEFWWEELQPEVWVGKDLPIQDQWAQEETSDACGQYMMTHGVNAMNLFRWWTFLYRWEEEREKFIDMFQHTPRYKNVDIRTQWSRLQDNLEFARRTGMIAWYYRVTWQDQKRKALSMGRVIATGSKKINRRETRQDPHVAVWNKWAWHFFCKTRYRDMINLFSCPNSYWTDAYDNWYFHIKYEDENLLYTQYALIPKEEKHITGQVKLKLYLSRIVLNRTNWQPSETDKMTYWKYIEYWFRRGDWQF